MTGREDLRMNVKEIEEIKQKFTIEAEKIRGKFTDFQQNIEYSLNTLQYSLQASLEAGLEEAKSSLTHSFPVYSSPIARELCTYHSKSQLITCTTDLNKLFRPLEKRLNETNLEFEVSISNLLDDFQEKNVVIRRKTGLREVGNQAKRTVERIREDPRRVVVSVQVVVLVCVLAGLGLWRGDTGQDMGGGLSAEVWREVGEYDGGSGAKRLAWVERYKVGIGEYTGQWESRKTAKGEEHISGYGTMLYSNEDIYEGYWKHGQRHGNGRLLTSQGFLCEGTWRYDAFTGWGRCLSPDGTSTSGHWKLGQLDGFGVISNLRNVTIGGFCEGEISGLGVKFTSEDEFVAGMWHQNAYNGHIVEFNRGNVKWSVYKAGKLQGNMTVIEANGVKYVGEWREGLRHGTGVETYPAETFSGSWSNGNATYIGVYTHNASFQSLYEGKTTPNISSCRLISPSISTGSLQSWYFHTSECNSEGHYLGQTDPQGRRHGYGTQTYPDNSSYTGYWSEDKRHGFGRKLDLTGEVWDGMWVENEFTGWGRYEDRESRYSGLWREEWMDGLGEVRDGDRVSMGEFRWNELHGMGIQYSSSTQGEISVGKWDYGRLTSPGVEMHGNVLYWGDFGTGEIREFRYQQPSGVMVRRYAQWSYCEVQTHTASFRTDRNVYLTAVGVGNSYDSSPVSISNLTVFSGNSTVIYTHSRSDLMRNWGNSSRFLTISMLPRVSLSANTVYTIQAVYSPDSRVHCYWRDEKEKYELEGVTVDCMATGRGDRSAIRDLHFQLD